VNCRKLFAASFLSIPFAFIASASADDLPSRKAGLWEMTTEIKMPNGQSRKAPSAKQCIDAATDAKMMKAAESMGAACTKRETTHSGDAYTTDAVCTVSGSTVSSHTVVSGDFNSSYHVESTGKMTPPLMGQSETHVSVDAKYLGPCAADQKPGDIIMPTGQKMNIADIEKMSAGLGQNAAKMPKAPN
jgi:hypothetical protein